MSYKRSMFRKVVDRCSSFSYKTLAMVASVIMLISTVMLASFYVELCATRGFAIKLQLLVEELLHPSGEGAHTAAKPALAVGSETEVSVVKVENQKVKILVDTLATRNKNPLNIKTPDGERWKGQIGEDRKHHAIFDTWESGFRAAAMTLKNYEARHNLTTIDEIVSRFAEAKGKNHDKYVAFLCKKLNLKPNQKFSIKKKMPELLKYMTRYESGQYFPDRFYLAYDVMTTL